MNPYAEPDCDTCCDSGVVAIPDDPGTAWDPPTGPWTLELCECASGPSEWFDTQRPAGPFILARATVQRAREQWSTAYARSQQRNVPRW